MRQPIDALRLRAVLEELGARSTGPGRIYLTGGASALLEGWRASTVDVDLKLDPEPPGIFRAIAAAKQQYAVNIELASPDQFVPVPSDWRSRSVFVERFGEVDVFHFDFRSQALAKLARGYDRDLEDVRAMLQRGLVERAELRATVAEIKPELLRYPGIDQGAFEQRVERFLSDADDG